MSRLDQEARNSRSGTLYSRFDYGYKVDGAINSWTKTLGTANPVDMGFTYDPIDRLTGATYKNGAAVLAQYGYTYDKADNRTTERRDQIVSTGTFNNVNELTALSGGGLVGFTGTTTEEAAAIFHAWPKPLSHRCKRGFVMETDEAAYGFTMRLMPAPMAALNP